MVYIYHVRSCSLVNLFFLYVCVSPFASAAPESERGESLHRECGQAAGHHGPADQVRCKSTHAQTCNINQSCNIVHRPLKAPVDKNNPNL